MFTELMLELSLLDKLMLIVSSSKVQVIEFSASCSLSSLFPPTSFSMVTLTSSTLPLLIFRFPQLLFIFTVSLLIL